MSKFANILVILGLLMMVMAGRLVWERNRPLDDTTPFNGSGFSSEKSYPQEIIISDIGLSLPLIPAKLSNNRWDQTSRGVSFLTSSPLPGEVGNSILYGHNWPNLLGPIVKLKPQQQIIIRFNDGTTKSFLIVDTKITSPNDITILEDSSQPMLTLYTCSGFLDSQRWVVLAKLI